MFLQVLLLPFFIQQQQKAKDSGGGTPGISQEQGSTPCGVALSLLWVLNTLTFKLINTIVTNLYTFTPVPYYAIIVHNCAYYLNLPASKDR